MGYGDRERSTQLTSSQIDLLLERQLLNNCNRLLVCLCPVAGTSPPGTGVLRWRGLIRLRARYGIGIWRHAAWVCYIWELASISTSVRVLREVGYTGAPLFPNCAQAAPAEAKSVGTASRIIEVLRYCNGTCTRACRSVNTFAMARQSHCYLYRQYHNPQLPWRWIRMRSASCGRQ